MRETVCHKLIANPGGFGLTETDWCRGVIFASVRQFEESHVLLIRVTDSDSVEDKRTSLDVSNLVPKRGLDRVLGFVERSLCPPGPEKMGCSQHITARRNNEAGSLNCGLSTRVRIDNIKKDVDYRFLSVLG